MHAFTVLLARRARTCSSVAIILVIVLRVHAEAQSAAGDDPRDSAKLALIRQLLDFYHTPIGRKMLAETPGLARESILTGQAWGAQLGAEVARQLAKEGIQPP